MERFHRVLLHARAWELFSSANLSRWANRPPMTNQTLLRRGARLALQQSRNRAEDPKRTREELRSLVRLPKIRPCRRYARRQYHLEERIRRGRSFVRGRTVCQNSR